MTTYTRRALVGLVVALTVAGCGSGGSTSPAPADTHVVIYQGPGGILMTINADGTGRADLIPQGRQKNADHPDWSPDGSHLVFVEHDDDGTTDIWVTAADGTVSPRARRLRGPMRGCRPKAAPHRTSTSSLPMELVCDE